MTKIRKYKGSYTIPIHKHSEIRRPYSKYIVAPFSNSRGLAFDFTFNHRPLVQDISTGPEDPLLLKTKVGDTFRYDPNKVVGEPEKNQKSNWNKRHKDMEERFNVGQDFLKEVDKSDGFYTLKDKPNVMNVLTDKMSFSTWLKIKLKRLLRVGRK